MNNKLVFLVIILLLLLPSINFFLKDKVGIDTSWIGLDIGDKEKYELNTHDIEEIRNRIEADLLSGDFHKVEDNFVRISDIKYSTISGKYPPVALTEVLFSKHSEQFLEATKAWLDKEPQSFYAHLLQGYLLYKYAWEARGSRFIGKTPEVSHRLYKQRLEESFQEFFHAAKLDSNNILVYLKLLTIGVEGGMPKRLRLHYLNKGKSIQPDSFELYYAYMRGLAPKWGGSEDEILEFARKSAKLINKENSNYRLQLLIPFAHNELCATKGGAKVYFADPIVWKEIEDSYKLLINHYPKAVGYYADYANYAFRGGRKSIGEEALTKALELDPRHPTLLKIKAQYAGMDPNTSELNPAQKELENKTHEAFKKGNMQEAEEGYEKLVKDFPNSGHYWYLLGRTRIHLNKRQPAEDAYNNAIKLNPTNPGYYSDRCLAKMLLRKLEEGIQDCTEAIRIDANEKYAYLNRARAYEMLGNKRAAQRDYAVANSLK